MIAPLSETERMDALSSLPSWSYDRERRAFYRQIRLDTFSAAFALMVRIAMEAEKADHHPEWSNVYNRIDIWLTTHDAGDVSVRDARLATIIDAMT